MGGTVIKKISVGHMHALVMYYCMIGFKWGGEGRGMGQLALKSASVFFGMRCTNDAHRVQVTLSPSEKY